MSDTTLIIICVIGMAYWPVVWTIEELMEKYLNRGERMTPTHTGTYIDFLSTGYSGQTNPLPRLKPCPFCGYGHILTWHLGHYDKPWLAECSKCSACGPHADTERDAIELWNRRKME